jgi:hypothetical protein
VGQAANPEDGALLGGLSFALLQTGKYYTKFQAKIKRKRN